MSKATKRKYVTQEVVNEYVLPTSDKRVVKILASRGNNLHEVVDANNDTFLVSMPTKFRKNVWIKRGDFVLVEPITEGDKVKAEIVNILYKDQIKYIKEMKLWPDSFLEKKSTDDSEMIPSDMLPPCDSDSDSETDTATAVESKDTDSNDED